MSNCTGCGKYQERCPIVVGRTGIIFCSECEHKLALKCINDIVNRHLEWNKLKKYPQGSDLVNPDKIIIDLDWKRILQ